MSSANLTTHLHPERQRTTDKAKSNDLDLMLQVAECKKKMLSDKDTAVQLNIPHYTVNALYNKYLDELKDSLKLDTEKISLVDQIQSQRQLIMREYELSKQPTVRRQTTRRRNRDTGEMEDFTEMTEVIESPTGNYRYLDLMDKYNNTLAEILGIKQINVNMDVEIRLPDQVTSLFDTDEVAEDAQIIE